MRDVNPLTHLRLRNFPVLIFTLPKLLTLFQCVHITNIEDKEAALASDASQLSMDEHRMIS